MISSSNDWMTTFIAGAGFGLTSVVIGQPLDTTKTRMQARPDLINHGVSYAAKDLWQKEGIRGFYRGGMPMFVGGAMLRSAQFGVYNAALNLVKDLDSQNASNSKICFGVIDYHVLIAGFCGGLGRGVVEVPFEFVKVRRQVGHDFKFTELYNGSAVTLTRNSVLFACFASYIDLSNRFVPGGLDPFWSGGICATLAWLTIWPMDVVKSQYQSGNFGQVSFLTLLRKARESGHLYAGLGPGLLRSFIANGASMMVYHKIKNALEDLNKKK